MAKIALELDYELVMITNQDGLGTDSHFQKTLFGQLKTKLLLLLRKKALFFLRY